MQCVGPGSILDASGDPLTVLNAIQCSVRYRSGVAGPRRHGQHPERSVMSVGTSAHTCNRGTPSTCRSLGSRGALALWHRKRSVAALHLRPGARCRGRSSASACSPSVVQREGCARATAQHCACGRPSASARRSRSGAAAGAGVGSATERARTHAGEMLRTGADRCAAKKELRPDERGVASLRG